MSKKTSNVSSDDAIVDRVLERCLKWVERSAERSPRVFFPNGIELIQIRGRQPTRDRGLDFEITLAGSGAAPKAFRSSLFAERIGRVQQACEDVFDENKDDCNKFVKAVASVLGVNLKGNADEIVAEIQRPPWTFIGNDLEAAKRASDLAAEDKFVIGGLTSYELGEAHGHVVVVVSGSLVNGMYPVAYWGSISQGKAGKLRGVNYAFRNPSCDSVRYGWI